MLKLIPSVPQGSWIIKQSVGSTPVLLGNKISTTYHRYRSLLMHYSISCMQYAHLAQTKISTSQHQRRALVMRSSSVRLHAKGSLQHVGTVRVPNMA